MMQTLTRKVPLWQQYRSEFPITERLVYLNHAAVAPLSKRCAEAMRSFVDDSEQYGSLHYDAWLQCYEGLRLAAAKLIGAARDEIAIVKNTSEGISTVAVGLDWRAGDKIIAFRDEFPANQWPWRRLEEKGVRVEWLAPTDSLERIDEACRGARLLAISFVQYLSGYRANLKAIGEICSRRGCFFFVDAIQGLGAFPLNVEACRIDALSADGHKWMLGPEGCGILYVRKARQDEITPVEFGWTNVAHYNDYGTTDATLRPDAGRYECGSLNTIGCYGLRAALDFLLEIGIDETAAAILEITGQLAKGARAKGYEMLGERREENAAGILSIRKPGLDSRLVVGRLKEGGIIAAPRQGWVRFSPHFYISPEDIGRVIDSLP